MQALKGQEDMTDVLLRNVYGDDTTRRHNAAALAQYVRRCARNAGFLMLQPAMFPSALQLPNSLNCPYGPTTAVAVLCAGRWLAWT